MILDYITGKLDVHAGREQQELMQSHTEMHGSALPLGAVPTPEQLQFLTYVKGNVDLVIRAHGEDISDAETARKELWEDGKIVSLTGGPGTGKTAYIHQAIEYALDRGGHVLFALPTAQLASRMRAKYGDKIDIDTCAAVFAFNEDQCFPYIGMYSLIVIDEISQLQGWQFQRIVQLWKQADQAVCVAVLGDKWQITGFGEERPWHTP